MTNEEGHQQTIRRNRDAGDGDNTLHNMRGRRMRLKIRVETAEWIWEEYE
jgi:hypothetical protein